jgi:hypothetical protein
MPKSLKSTPTNRDKMQDIVKRAAIKGTPSNYDVAAMNKLKPKKRNNKVKQTGPR